MPKIIRFVLCMFSLLLSFVLGGYTVYYAGVKNLQKQSYIGFAGATLNSYLYHKELNKLVKTRDYEKIEVSMEKQKRDESKTIQECFTIKWCSSTIHDQVESYAPELRPPTSKP